MTDNDTEKISTTFVDGTAKIPAASVAYGEFLQDAVNLGLTDAQALQLVNKYFTWPADIDPPSVTFESLITRIDKVTMRGVYRVSEDCGVDVDVELIHSQGSDEGQAILLGNEIEMSFAQTEEFILALQQQLEVGRRAFRITP